MITRTAERPFLELRFVPRGFYCKPTYWWRGHPWLAGLEFVEIGMLTPD